MTANKMTEPQATEQITAPPKEEAPVKIKDPRRVAAGKALAARNKAAREAKKQQVDSSWGSRGEAPSFNGVMQIAAVVGAGFTLYHGYQVVKPYLTKRDPTEPYERPVETTFVNAKQPSSEGEVKPLQSEPVKNEIKGIDME